jgi:hypothetical protein
MNLRLPAWFVKLALERRALDKEGCRNGADVQTRPAVSRASRTRLRSAMVTTWYHAGPAPRAVASLPEPGALRPQRQANQISQELASHSPTMHCQPLFAVSCEMLRIVSGLGCTSLKISADALWHYICPASHSRQFIWIDRSNIRIRNSFSRPENGYISEYSEKTDEHCCTSRLARSQRSQRVTARSGGHYDA